VVVSGSSGGRQEKRGTLGKGVKLLCMRLKSKVVEARRNYKKNGGAQKEIKREGNTREMGLMSEAVTGGGPKGRGEKGERKREPSSHPFKKRSRRKGAHDRQEKHKKKKRLGGRRGGREVSQSSIVTPPRAVGGPQKLKGRKNGREEH